MNGKNTTDLAPETESAETSSSPTSDLSPEPSAETSAEPTAETSAETDNARASGAGAAVKKRFDLKREAITFGLLCIAALFGAFGMHVFVTPAEFAPTGIDGVAIMLQYKTGLNVGIYTAVLNLPLFVGAWFLVNKRYVILTGIFIVITSLLMMLLEEANMWQYSGVTVTDFDRLLAAIFAGAMLGVRTGVMFRIGGSAGGADVIASMLQAKRPYMRAERVTTLICFGITGVSFFVYRDLNAVLLSFVQLFVFEKVMDRIMAPTHSAIQVKIITRHPDEIRKELLFRFKHGGTLTDSHGLYTGEGTSVITSVINIRQLGEFTMMIQKFPEAFVYYSDVRGVMGNFRWRKSDEAK